jgi:hypothetical protein
MTTTQIGTGEEIAAGSVHLPEGTGAVNDPAGSLATQNPGTAQPGTGTEEPTSRPGSPVPSVKPRPWVKRATGTGTGTRNPGTGSGFPGFTDDAGLTDEELDELTDEEYELHLARLAAGEFDAPRDWMSFALWAAIWSVTAVATYMAAVGQIEGTWIWAGQDKEDPRRFGVVFLFEVGVIAWLLIGKFAMSEKGGSRSPYPWWGVAAVFATLAVYTNSVHGDGDHAWREGVLFGTASALSLALWFAKFYLDYMASEIASGRRTGNRPKVVTIPNLLSQPRLTARAYLIVRRRHQVTTDDKAFEMAEMWQWIFQDTLAVKAKPRPTGAAVTTEASSVGVERNRGWAERRRIARRTAWLCVNRELGVKTIVPKGVEIAAVEFAAPSPPPTGEPTRAPKRRERVQEEDASVPASRLPHQSRNEENPVMLDKDRPDPVWFATYQKRFQPVADSLPNWRVMARTGRLTADMVQQNGVGNRTAAMHVRKCLMAIAYDQVPADAVQYVPGSMR